MWSVGVFRASSNTDFVLGSTFNFSFISHSFRQNEQTTHGVRLMFCKHCFVQLLYSSAYAVASITNLGGGILGPSDSTSKFRQ